MTKTTDLPGPDGILFPNGVYVDGHGQKIYSIHDSRLCEGRPCAIHNPSEHSMRAFPTLVRIPHFFDIKPLHIERTCPHGVGHPDPDDMYYHINVRNDPSMGVHGCDGCCMTPERKREVFGAGWPWPCTQCDGNGWRAIADWHLECCGLPYFETGECCCDPAEVADMVQTECDHCNGTGDEPDRG